MLNFAGACRSASVACWGPRTTPASEPALKHPQNHDFAPSTSEPALGHPLNSDSRILNQRARLPQNAVVRAYRLGHPQNTDFRTFHLASPQNADLRAFHQVRHAVRRVSPHVRRGGWSTPLPPTTPRDVVWLTLSAAAFARRSPPNIPAGGRQAGVSRARAHMLSQRQAMHGGERIAPV